MGGDGGCAVKHSNGSVGLGTLGTELPFLTTRYTRSAASGAEVGSPYPGLWAIL